MAKLIKEKRTKNRPDSKKAMEALHRLRELSSRYGGPTKGMTEKEIIASIKKTREELWDQYLASHSRR